MRKRKTKRRTTRTKMKRSRWRRIITITIANNTTSKTLVRKSTERTVKISKTLWTARIWSV